MCLLWCVRWLRLVLLNGCELYAEFIDSVSFPLCVALTSSRTRTNIFPPQDVDLVIAGMTITAERSTVVDFSYMYWEEKVGMLTGTLPVDPFYMFKPLHIYVWMCFATAALVTAISAACYEISSIKIEATSKKGFLLPLESLWCTLRAMWVQGKFHIYEFWFHIGFTTGDISSDCGLKNDKGLS